MAFKKYFSTVFILYLITIGGNSLAFGGQQCARPRKPKKSVGIQLENTSRNSISSQYNPADYQEAKELPTNSNELTPFAADSLLIQHCMQGTLTRELRDNLVHVHHADINARCGLPLLYAAEHGYESVVDLLLEVNADVTKLESAALRHASAKGRAAIVKKLLDAGAGSHHWGGSLYPAAEQGHVAAVNILVAYPDPKIAYSFNRSLCVACHKGFLPIVEIFMRHLDTCDLNVENGKPLKSACAGLLAMLQDQSKRPQGKIEEYINIISLLLDNGASPCYCLSELVTLSVRCNDIILLQYCLLYGSTVGNFPIDEKTIHDSIHVAEAHQFERVQKLLEEYLVFLTTCTKTWWGGFERI